MAREGFDPERDRWSRRATEDLFPAIALRVFNTPQDKIVYAWNDQSIDRMDKEYGIDALLHTPKRNVALAIRIRGYEYYQKFGDITIRLDSLQTLGKMLEMQKSIARFMFYAWGNTDKPYAPTVFADWHVVFLQRLVDLFLAKRIRYSGPFVNGDKSSRLVGFAVPELERHGLIYMSKINQLRLTEAA
jgi:hypothetical protein